MAKGVPLEEVRSMRPGLKMLLDYLREKELI